MNLFPVYYLLFPYALVVIITLLFLVFNVLHIYKFGVNAAQTTKVITAYSLAFLCALTFGIALLISQEWTHVLTVNNIFQFEISTGDLYGI